MTTSIITTYAGVGTIAGHTGDGGPAVAAYFGKIVGIGMDKAGRLIVTDPDTNRIRMVNASGIVTTICGTGALGYSGDGGPATAAKANGPDHVYINCGEQIYFNDNNQVTRVFSINEAPVFANSADSINYVCVNDTLSLGTLLSINDSDIGQSETWTILSGSIHGALHGFPYGSTLTATTLIPSGCCKFPFSFRWQAIMLRGKFG